MKKTIATLFALSAVAMGAEPLMLDWNDYGTAQLTSSDFANNHITVAVNLNWKEICDADVDSCIFSIKNALESSSEIGMGVEVASNRYIDTWIDGKVNYNILSKTLSNDDLAAHSAAMVFEAYLVDAVTYSMQATLYLWDAEGKLLNDSAYNMGPTPNGWNEVSIKQYSAITINQNYVNNADVYIGKQDVVSVVDRVMNPPSPSIPEPATATLSLLALAGLAARRRR